MTQSLIFWLIINQAKTEILDSSPSEKYAHQLVEHYNNKLNTKSCKACASNSKYVLEHFKGEEIEMWYGNW